MKTETGTVEFIGDIIPVSDKFQKRDIVIKQLFNGRTGPYENFIKFQLLQEKVTYIDQFPLGTMVDVSFDLKGRKVEKDGETKYYTNIDAWKIQLSAEQPPVTSQASASTGTAAAGATGPISGQAPVAAAQAQAAAPVAAVKPGDTSQIPPASGAAGDQGPDDLPF